MAVSSKVGEGLQIAPLFHLETNLDSVRLIFHSKTSLERVELIFRSENSLDSLELIFHSETPLEIAKPQEVVWML